MQARAVRGCDLEARGGLEVGAWVALGVERPILLSVFGCVR